MGALKQLYLDNGGDEHEVDAQETHSQYVRTTNLAKAIESVARDVFRGKRQCVYKRRKHKILMSYSPKSYEASYSLWVRYNWLGFIPRYKFVGCANVLTSLCWLVAYDEVYNQ